MSQILVETELDKGCSFCQIGFQNRPGNQLFRFVFNEGDKETLTEALASSGLFLYYHFFF